MLLPSCSAEGRSFQDTTQHTALVPVRPVEPLAGIGRASIHVVSVLSILLEMLQGPTCRRGKRDTDLIRHRAAELCLLWGFVLLALARVIILFFGFPSLTPLLPHIDHRNRGMRTRLGCLSHKSDSYNDFTAILPDKPNRALK